ncbi:MAG: alpha/beta hydrolase-fold protein [Bryobacteraceae bacterium]
MSRVALVFAAFATIAFAQPPGGPRRVVSPEVHPDRRITFRIAGPKAADVAVLFGEGGAPKPHPMTKGDDGVWSATVGPVAPEIYTYSFLVGGVKTIDLANPILKVGAAIDASVVEVLGDPPRFDQVQAVPHGSINIHTYASAVSKTQRGLYVYVPPGYAAERGKRYPVLYLWHGGGGAEQDWSRDGRAGVILDNLVAQKKTVPMLIVMPNNVPGAPAPGVAAGAPVPATGAGGANYPMLKRELLEEIIPFVASHYRTIEKRESRAIAGLSAGGGTTMNVGLSTLDSFAWVAEFSSGIFGGTAAYAQTFDIEKIAPGFYKDPAAVNKKLKLFYMSCGTEDPRMPFQKKALEDFRSHRIEVTFAEFPGAHEWKVWRHSLADLAPKLFR